MSTQNPQSVDSTAPVKAVPASPEPTLSGLVALASTVIVVSGSVLLFALAAFLVWTQPDLTDNPIVLPLLGAMLFGGTVVAIVGLIAGIVNLLQPGQNRGLPVLAVIINTSICVAVFSLIVLTLLNS